MSIALIWIYCLVIPPRVLLWRLRSPASRLSILRSWGYHRSGRLPLTQGQEQGARARGRGKGKGPTSSSRAGAEEEEDEDVEEMKKRTVWSMAENVALAKAWVGVVEDLYIGANQHINRMWFRISQGYLQFKSNYGKPHGSEQCQKQWERLRPKLSRFAGIYQNNLRQATNGMSEEDVKNLSIQQYPDRALKFREFKHWEVYLVVKNYGKFCAGVEAGWPKRTKISTSGEYNSRAGLHELPEAEAEIPTPQASSRCRRRPVGQKTAQRIARGSASGSDEVQSKATPEYNNLARAQQIRSLVQTNEMWHNATDHLYKRMLKDVIDTLRRDLGMPPLPDNGIGTGGGDDEE